MQRRQVKDFIHDIQFWSGCFENGEGRTLPSTISVLLSNLPKVITGAYRGRKAITWCRMSTDTHHPLL